MAHFDEFQRGVGREWRGLHYDCVPGQEAWDNLLHRENKGKVPWADGANYSEWNVAKRDVEFFIVLNCLLLWRRDSCCVWLVTITCFVVIGYTVKLEDSRGGVDLKLRELNLVKISDNSDLIGCGVSSYRLPTFF